MLEFSHIHLFEGIGIVIYDYDDTNMGSQLHLSFLLDHYDDVWF